MKALRRHAKDCGNGTTSEQIRSIYQTGELGGNIKRK
jgi:hypothetical protein